MATIGSMIVNLGLNKKGFDTGLGGAKKGLTGFAATTGKIIGKVFGIGGALAGLAGIAGFSIMTKQAFTSIDATAKLSKQLGVATEDLIGLQHAAGLSGVDPSAMNKALQKYQANIGEAMTGTGAAKDALDQLGLSAHTLAGLDPSQGFAEVAGALADVETRAEQASIVKDIFGRAGQDLLPLLDEGKDGIARMVAEAEELGKTFSGTDAAKVEAANDAMLRMKGAVTGIAQRVAIGLAPAIEWTAGAFTTVLRKGREVWEFLTPLTTQYANVVRTEFGVIKTWVSSIFGSLAGDGMSFFTTVRDGAVEFLIGAEFAWKNWEQVGSLAIDTVILKFLQWAGETHHFFAAVLPGYLTWVADNFTDVFFTAFDAVTTGFINLGQNIRDNMTAVWEFIKSGGTKDLELTWTPLLDGFHSTIKQLPDIPPRAIGALEQQIASQVSAAEQMLGEDFAAFRTERLATLNAAAQQADAAGPATPGDPGTDVDGPVKGDVKSPRTLEAGSKEAVSAILKAQAASQGAGQTLEDTAKKQLQADKQQVALLRAIRDKEPRQSDTVLEIY